MMYLGKKLTHQGVKPDPQQVIGICTMPVPMTKEQVCAEVVSKDNNPEKTAIEEQLAVRSQMGKGIAKHKRLFHNGTTSEVLLSR